MNLSDRMLAHSIDHCTESAGHRRKRRESSITTIALWATVAALLVAYVVFK